MIAILAAGILAPFFVEVTPEVRSSYVSLGKLMEDRPMQITNVRVGYDRAGGVARGAAFLVYYAAILRLS